MVTRSKTVIIEFIILISYQISEAKYPDSLMNNTSCDEFSSSARFNPYSVLDKDWLVFYYWGPAMTTMVMKFEYPTPKAKAFLHHVLDEFVSVPINWTARFVVMTNLRTNGSSFLVEVGDRGQFLKYAIAKCSKKFPRIEPIDVRLKQFDGGKYIAYMECGRDTVYLMAKKEDIPPKNQLQDVAAKAGYRCRGGKSYLYQGHKWMPVPEEEDDTFWLKEEDVEREKKKLDFMRIQAEKKLKAREEEKN